MGHRCAPTFVFLFGDSRQLQASHVIPGSGAAQPSRTAFARAAWFAMTLELTAMKVAISSSPTPSQSLASYASTRLFRPCATAIPASGQGQDDDPLAAEQAPPSVTVPESGPNSATHSSRLFRQETIYRPKPKPKRDVHSRGDRDWLGYASEASPPHLKNDPAPPLHLHNLRISP